MHSSLRRTSYDLFDLKKIWMDVRLRGPLSRSDTALALWYGLVAALWVELFFFFPSELWVSSFEPGIRSYAYVRDTCSRPLHVGCLLLLFLRLFYRSFPRTLNFLFGNPVFVLRISFCTFSLSPFLFSPLCLPTYLLFLSRVVFLCLVEMSSRYWCLRNCVFQEMVAKRY